MDARNETQTPPPDFLSAKNRRQKVRAAGMNPDYWYPVEYSKNVPAGKAIEAKFWKRSIAVFRGMDGRLRATEDRCAHRQLKISTGEVSGCNLVCPYHGWAFDGDGKVAHIPHDLFGHEMPDLRIGSYPVQEQYGLIWVFPGDKKLAAERKIPSIPELTGPRESRWGQVLIDFEVKAHHSMIIDNVSDFAHAYLHRKYRPFSDAKITHCYAEGDRVYVSYDTKVGTGPISGLFVDRRGINTNAMDLCYEYPYQWSNTDGKIKDYCFVLPIDERTTRAFFLFYFDHFKIPFSPFRLPHRLMPALLFFGKKLHIAPLLEEDRMAVELEQEGYERHHDAPIAELNPAVNLFQQLTIRKWEEHLVKTGALSPGALAASVAVSAAPGGVA